MLKAVVLFIILAPYDNEQSDFMNRVAEHKLIDETPAFKQLIRQFLTQQIMKASDLKATYGESWLTAAIPTDNP